MRNSPQESIRSKVVARAINLSSDKALVLFEIHRVLRPGGRLLMADMFLEDGVSQETVARLDAWSD